MSELDRINELLELYNQDDQMLRMDGYDDCIVGVCCRFGQVPILAYDYRRVINKLMEEQGMSREEADEWFNYNQIGAWVGDGTPCFIVTRVTDD